MPSAENFHQKLTRSCRAEPLHVILKRSSKRLSTSLFASQAVETAPRALGIVTTARTRSGQSPMLYCMQSPAWNFTCTWQRPWQWPQQKRNNCVVFLLGSGCMVVVGTRLSNPQRLQSVMQQPSAASPSVHARERVGWTTCRTADSTPGHELVAASHLDREDER